MYARPQFEDGETTTLGVSGKLWREALIMYDRRSRTLWSQIDGRAKAGPLEGRALEKIPSQVTTWAAWRARHPETLVLVKPALERSAYASYHEKASWVGLPWQRGARDERLPPKTLVLGVDLGPSVEADGLAVRLDSLDATGLLARTVDDTPILVVTDGDPRAALAYVRRVDRQILDFEWHAEGDAPPKALVDRQTGSTWSWLTGTALTGPLEGRTLEPLPTTPIYWTTWVAFHPETALW